MRILKRRIPKRVLALGLAAIMLLTIIPIHDYFANRALASAVSKTIAGVDVAGVISNAEPSYAALNSSTAWNGDYIVGVDTTLTTVNVTENTKIWISQGNTLTINGVTGEAGDTKTSGSSSEGGYAPITSALTIADGKTLTFEGEGKLVITGGTGGAAMDFFGTPNECPTSQGGYGGVGGKGGVAIQIGADSTLEFGKGMTGFVEILGGTGGEGGNGEGGKNNTTGQYSSDNATYYAGSGGRGGQGGVAIVNSGTIIFNQDNANANLTQDGAYATGNINIKGGYGGNGGNGGTAGIASTKITQNAPTEPYNTHQANPPTASGAFGSATYSVLKPSSGGSDIVTQYFTKGGNSGGSGTGEYAVIGGTIKFNRGVATIEGGNFQGAGVPGAFNTTVTHTSSYNSIKRRDYTNYHLENYNGTTETPDGSGIYSAYSRGADTAHCHTYAEFDVPSSSPGIAPGSSHSPALNDVTVYNNGGTNYISGGGGGAVAAYDGTTSFQAEAQHTGSLFINKNIGHLEEAPTTGIQVVQASYLEGFGNLANMGENFYVLGKGDTWRDIDGDVHTSKGLLVNGTAYTTEDLFVSPQGKLYLTGVAPTANISFDLAVNSTRNGAVGVYPKDVRLNNLGGGVYHFSGTANGLVTASYALDGETDGAGAGTETSYDSSFDMPWLRAQNFSPTINITTAPQLAAIAWAVNNGVQNANTAVYTLGNNIDLGNFNWTPIGTKDNPFKGSFNGNGHTVLNLRVRSIDNRQAYGLFGHAVGADISNFKLARDAFNHPQIATIKVDKAPLTSAVISGAGYSILAENYVFIDRTGLTGNVYAGVAVGHAVDSDINKIEAIGMDVKTIVTDATAVNAVGGIVGYAYSTAPQRGTRSYTELKMSGTSGMVHATGGGKTYAGGAIGYLNNIDLTAPNLSNAAVQVISSQGTAWAGGQIGYAENVTVSGAVSAAASDINASGAYLYNSILANATANAYIGGIVGEAVKTDIIKSTLTGVKTFKAQSSDGLAYAGGVAGSIIGTQETAAVTSENEIKPVLPSTPITVSAISSSTEANKNAYAGGLLGFAEESTVYANKFTVNSTANNLVEALSQTGTAYAGGLLGYINNQGFANVSIAGMTVKNVKVVAAGADESSASGNEAYAGGVAGQATAARGVELTNVSVKGSGASSAIVAYGKNDTYAARLVGFTTKININSCEFDNHIVSPVADVTVSAKSVEGDIYAAGLAGKITAYGSVNASSVNRVNIVADGTKTVWVGGLLGYAENTSITASDVNRYLNASAVEQFTVSSVTVSNAAKTFAGGIGGEIVNQHPLGSEQENTYKLNNAVSMTFDLPDTKEVIAGGLYGKINNALIGASYARDYQIETNNAPSYAASSKVAGVVGDLKGSELIAVYGVGRGGAHITSFPGMYHTGVNNKFYGSYAYHSTFAIHPDEDSNTYANTYYANGSTVPNYIPNTVTSIPAAVDYYMLGNSKYELMTKKDGVTYKYTDLQAANPAKFTSVEVNDSMYNLLHIYKTYVQAKGGTFPINIGPSEITTRYEARLGFALQYSIDGTGISGNFSYPRMIPPKDFTLSVMPGLDYGHIKENEEGKKPYSTYTKLETRIFTRDTKLVFTAEEQATLPKDPYFYAFKQWNFLTANATLPYSWDYNANNLQEQSSSTIASPYSDGTIRINMPDVPMKLTAVFEQRDNRIRGAINTAISKQMEALIQTDKDDIQAALTAGDKETALNIILDNIFSTRDFLTVFEKQIKDTDTNTNDEYDGSINPTFASVYPQAHVSLYDAIKDKEMVAKQIVRETLETVIHRNNFVSGSYDNDITALTKKIEFVDIGVDLFSSAGTFNKYVSSQWAFEHSGDLDNTTPHNTQVGILSANGMTITVATLFDGKGAPLNSSLNENDTFGHGVAGGVYISYVNPHDYGAASDTTIWQKVSSTNGTYEYTIDASKLVNDDGSKYIYLREVDENGFEVVTRTQVGTSSIASINLPVNDGTGANISTASSTNIALGDGSTSTSLRVDSTALWYDSVKLEKSSSELNFDGSPCVDAAGAEFYYNGRGGIQQNTSHSTTPISGAYAEGIYLQIDADLFTTPPTNPAFKPIYSPTTPTDIIAYEYPATASNINITGLNGTPNAFTATLTAQAFTYDDKDTFPADGSPDFMSGTLVYKPMTGVSIVTKYVNFLGEINAATGSDILYEIAQVATASHFAEVMGIAQEVKTEFENRMDASVTNPLLQDENTIKLLSQLKPADGYKDAGQVDGIFSSVVALQELLEVSYSDPDFISTLTVADQGRIKQMQERTTKLLEGNSYTPTSTGVYPVLNPAEFTKNLELLYTTGQTFYNILKAVQFDTVAITINTNLPQYVTTAAGMQTGQNSLVSGTLYDISGAVPTPSSVTAFNFPNISFPAGTVLGSARDFSGFMDSKNLIIRKKSAFDINILDAAAAAGYNYVAWLESASGTSLTFTSGSGKSTYTLDSTKTSTNQILNIVFAKKKYAVAVPASVTDAGVQVAAVTSSASNGNIEHGASLVITLLPSPDHVYKAGETVEYKMGGVDKTTTVLPNGTIVIANVTGAITDLNLTGVIIESTKTALTSKIGEVETLNFTKEKYTPSTWSKLQEVLKIAEDVESSGTSTLQEIATAYENLTKAVGLLVPQHKVTLDPKLSVLIDPSVNSTHDYFDSTANGQYTKVQPGVVKIGTDYYVQDGYSVVLEPTASVPAGNIIKAVTYDQAAPVVLSDAKATVLPNGKVVVTNVKGDISNFDVTTGATEFNAVEGSLTSPDGANVTDPNGKVVPAGKGEQGKERIPVVLLPDLEISPIAASPSTLAATFTDSLGHEVSISIPLNDNNDETNDTNTTVNISVTVGGITTVVTLPESEITSYITGTAPAITVKIPSEALQEIIDEYNGTTATPKIVITEPEIEIEAAVTDKNGTVVTQAPSPKTTAPVTEVPEYTVTPARGYVTTEVHVKTPSTEDTDDAAVSYPSESVIAAIIISPTTVTASGTDTVYVKNDPSTGGETTVIVNKDGEVTAVIVNPGVNTDYIVDFNRDIDDPNYGEAVITWKEPVKEAFVIDAVFARNIFDFEAVQPDNGSVKVTTNKTVTPAISGILAQGSPSSIIITPNIGYGINPNGIVTITIDGTQGLPDVVYSDTLKNLADTSLYPDLTVSAINTAPVTITIDRVLGSMEVTTTALIKSERYEDTKADIIKALEELKKSVDLGKDIVTANPSSVTYDTSKPEWKDFNDTTASVHTDKLEVAGEDLYDLLAKPNGDIKDTIINAGSASSLVSIIDSYLPNKEFADLDEILAYILETKQALDDAILKLPTKSGETAIIPSMTDVVGTDGGILPGTKPHISQPTDGGVNNTSDKVVITGVKPTTGNVATAVSLTITDPETGNAYEVIVPINGGVDLGVEGSKLVAKKIDPSTGEPTGPEFHVVIPSTDVGAKESPAGTIEVAGKTISDIVTALTGDTAPKGVVTAIGIVTEKDSSPEFVVGTDIVSVDGGISSQPTLTSPASGGINVATDGITVSGIATKTNYVYEGIEIVFLDEAKQPHTIFIAASTSNTTGTTTLETAITNKDLKDAISAELVTPHDFTKIIITDIKTVTDGVEVSVGKVVTDKGITGTITVIAPTGGQGTIDNISDIVVDGVVVATGTEIENVLVKIIDPNTGKTVYAEIPVTSPAENLENTVIQILDENKHPIGTITIHEDVNSASVTGGEVHIPTATVNEILDELRKSTDPAIKINTGSVSGIELDAERVGRAVPPDNSDVDGKGITSAEIKTSGTPNDGVLKPSEDLIVDNVATKTGFDVDKVTIMVTNPITGKDVWITVPVAKTLKDGDTVEISYITDKGAVVSTTTTIGPLPNQLPLADIKDIAYGAASGTNPSTGKIILPATAVDILIKKAVETAVKSEFGQGTLDELPPDYLDYIDIKDVIVVGKGGQYVIDVPDTAATGRGINPAKIPTVTVSGADYDSTNLGDGNVVGGIPTDVYSEQGILLISGISPQSGFLPKSTVVTLVDDDGNIAKITLPLSKAWVEGDKVTVEVNGVTKTLDAGTAGLNLLSELNAADLGTVRTPGQPTSYTASVPAVIISAIAASITTLDAVPTTFSMPAEISEITVVGERVAFGLPASPTPAKSDGISKSGEIYTQPNTTTTNKAVIDPTKGIVVSNITSAASVTGVEIKLPSETGTVNVIIMLKPSPSTGTTVRITDANGNDIFPSEEILSKITMTATPSSNVYEAELSGSVLEAIYAAAGITEPNGVGTVTVLSSVPATTVPTVTGMSHGHLTEDPDSVAKTEDLIVDNIRSEKGYALESLTIEAVNGTGDVTKFITIPSETTIDPITGIPSIAVQVRDEKTGLPTTINVDLSKLENVLTDTASNGFPMQKVFIPGRVLDEIINMVFATSDVDIVDITVNSRPAGWLMPTAETILLNQPEGLDALTITNSLVADADSSSGVISANGSGGDDNRIVVPDSLFMDIKFAKDDYPSTATSNTFHTVDGLVINGMLFEIDELLSIGAVKFIQGGDPLNDIFTQTAKLELITDIFVPYYEALTNEKLTGFDTMGISTQPQNNQYISFVEEFEKLSEYTDAEKLNAPTRTEYEELVAKLLDEFSPTASITLSPDNLEHLVDHKAELLEMDAKIKELLAAEREISEIEKLYEELSDKLNDADGNFNGIKDVPSIIANRVTAPDLFDEIKAVITSLEAEIATTKDLYDKLPTDAKDIVIESGAYDKLAEMESLLDALKEIDLGEEGYVQYKVEKFPSPAPDINPIDQLSDQTTVVTNLIAYNEELNELEYSFAKLTPEQRAKMPDTEKTLHDLRANVTAEFLDLGKAFAFEHLVVGSDATYVPNPDGTSKNSTNGIKTTTTDIKNLVRTAQEAYNLLGRSSVEAINAIDAVFYGPTLNQLSSLVNGVSSNSVDNTATSSDFDAAKAKIEQEYARLLEENGDDYTASQKDALLKAKEDALAAIENLRNNNPPPRKSEVVRETTAGITEMNKITVTVANQSFKDDAIAKVIAEHDRLISTHPDYTPSQKATLDNIRDTAIAAINAATSEARVTAIKDGAISALNSVPHGLLPTIGGGAGTTVGGAGTTVGGTYTQSPPDPNDGSIVTIVVVPDPGYTLVSIEVINNFTTHVIPLSKLSSSTYTYYYPANGTVTVIVKFTRLTDPADPNKNGINSQLNATDHMAYMVGVGNNRFAPELSISRAEVAMIFYKLMRDKNGDKSKRFTDVADGLWYSDAINLLAAKGIITGYPNGIFLPKNPITTAELTSIALKFAAHSSGVDEIPTVNAKHWAYEKLKTANYYHWYDTVDVISLPNAYLTRAQGAAIINNILGRDADKTFVDTMDILITFRDVTEKLPYYYDIMEATNPHNYIKTPSKEFWAILEK